jgi:hypothetical protein
MHNLSLITIIVILVTHTTSCKKMSALDELRCARDALKRAKAAVSAMPCKGHQAKKLEVMNALVDIDMSIGQAKVKVNELTNLETAVNGDELLLAIYEDEISEMIRTKVGTSNIVSRLAKMLEMLGRPAANELRDNLAKKYPDHVVVKLFACK